MRGLWLLVVVIGACRIPDEHYKNVGGGDDEKQYRRHEEKIEGALRCCGEEKGEVDR